MTSDSTGRGAQYALGRLADAAVDGGRLPSLRVAAGLEGGAWWSRDLGDVGRQYRIGSITKTFTAALVMRLRDDGRVELDDLVSKHVPDAPLAESTIRTLLSHGSGMPAEPTGPWWERSPGRAWDDLARANAGRRRVFPQSRRHHYSNLGYAVLGELVARRRGAGWWECVRSELLEPLGLRDTTYLPGEDAAVGTSRNPQTGALVGERVQETGAMAPAGQLWSTPDDLLAWSMAIARGAGDVLSPDTAAEMRTAQSADPDEQHRGAYGLGLRLRWSATGTLVGHTGSMPGFLAAMFADPTTGVSAVVMTNATTGLDTEQLAADVVATMQPMGYHRHEREDEPDPEDGLPDLVGDWFWGNTPHVLEATIDGLKLVARDEGNRFLRVGADLYRGLDGYFAGEELQVVRRPDGSVSHLEVATFVLTRTPYDPDAPIPGGPPLPLD